MMYVCLWSPVWSTGEESAAEGTAEAATWLSELAPRLRVEAERVWADGRGLDPVALASRLLERLADEGVTARAGVAAVPVAAELAARWGAQREGDEKVTPFLVKERTGFGWRRTAGAPAPEPVSPPDGSSVPDRSSMLAASSASASSASASSASGCSASGCSASGCSAEFVVEVPRGGEAGWLARLPVVALEPEARVRALLEGVGITTVGALAELPREAVEVRFGADAVALWRLARGDDRRILFRRVPPPRPHGSMDFVDYVLTDPARLVFTANALLGPICERLSRRGEHARVLRIVLPLADGSAWSRVLRPARPTASRETWLRLIRGLLERLTVPDAVTGMQLEVMDAEAAAVRQGDLFDVGFATAAAVEGAVARLMERQVPPVTPRRSSHPLLERRVEWVPTRVEGSGHAPDERRRPAPTGAAAEPAPPALSLRLLPEPRRIGIETARRRDHEIPRRLRDRRGWQEIAMAAGPDRISGGQWEQAPFAREYFRCVTGEGEPLWIYRDAVDGAWYLHGWWD